MISTVQASITRLHLYQTKNWLVKRLSTIFIRIIQPGVQGKCLHNSKNRGYHVGRRKARRYMNEMDIYPIYPKMNLSKRVQQAKVCPYLLRNAVIDAPNQAWSIDITYIPIRHGFLYLTAVIDWYSRCIVGWEIDDTLDTRMVINALKKCICCVKIHRFWNSDQGCQFTSQQYIEF